MNHSDLIHLIFRMKFGEQEAEKKSHDILLEKKKRLTEKIQLESEKRKEIVRLL